MPDQMQWSRRVPASQHPCVGREGEGGRHGVRLTVQRQVTAAASKDAAAYFNGKKTHEDIRHTFICRLLHQHAIFHMWSDSLKSGYQFVPIIYISFIVRRHLT